MDTGEHKSLAGRIGGFLIETGRMTWEVLLAWVVILAIFSAMRMAVDTAEPIVSAVQAANTAGFRSCDNQAAGDAGTNGCPTEKNRQWPPADVKPR